VGLKFFEFEFKKLKNVEKSLKIFRDLLSLMVSNLLQTSFIEYKFRPKQVKPKKEKKKTRRSIMAHLGPTIGGVKISPPMLPTP
jgi:phosphatidylinositol kinase/protein kinase (PI-3  family)